MPKKILSWSLPFLALIAIGGGLYILLLVVTPMWSDWLFDGKNDVKIAMQSTRAGAQGDRLFIPQIGVDVPIVQGTDISVLDKGAWHRQPQNGNPEKGGNFVLSAHRFSMGWTPQQTREKSPFYRIDTLKAGDEFFVDYRATRYAYKIVRTYNVPPTAVGIEAPSAEAKLTLYSCDLRGAAAGRVVVEARPAGKV